VKHNAQEAAEGRMAHNNVWNGINYTDTMCLRPLNVFCSSHYYEPVLPIEGVIYRL
jgi:hypothetical protein